MIFNWELSGGFTDANNRHVTALDVVEYRIGARRGVVMEIFSDGAALVAFRDTKKVEDVNWCHLCKVPAIDEK